ncbi:hypothetical protein HYC85_000466 [Camellia sinensis]|uniref:U-box domain-containing protein n=1 Tax=Camellia sinensis TaxID=4442 RepID=A0A7J7I3R4_CAMSI|nr:hypothetical protein HYC85_000466 [Camellia sinensis]
MTLGSEGEEDMDKASIIKDAIDYIQELHEQERRIQADLIQLESGKLKKNAVFDLDQEIPTLSRLKKKGIDHSYDSRRSTTSSIEDLESCQSPLVVPIITATATASPTLLLDCLTARQFGKYQKSIELLILKLPFKRLVHEIARDFKDIMEEPCVAADGYTYDCKAIQTWLEENDKSLMTNLPLPTRNLIPNYTLLSAIKDSNLAAEKKSGDPTGKGWGRIWKERVSAGTRVQRRAYLPVMQEGIPMESESVGPKPRRPSNRMILPSISAPEHNILQLLEECNASGI